MNGSVDYRSQACNSYFEWDRTYEPVFWSICPWGEPTNMLNRVWWVLLISSMRWVRPSFNQGDVVCQTIQDVMGTLDALQIFGNGLPKCQFDYFPWLSNAGLRRLLCHSSSDEFYKNCWHEEVYFRFQRVFNMIVSKLSSPFAANHLEHAMLNSSATSCDWVASDKIVRRISPRSSHWWDI